MGQIIVECANGGGLGVILQYCNDIAPGILRNDVNVFTNVIAYAGGGARRGG